MNTAPAGAGQSTGRFDLSHADLIRIKTMLHEDSGIQIANDHFAMVKCRLAKLLNESQLESFAALVEEVARPSGRHLRAEMMSALTTNVTHFFREKHHFDFMIDNVLSGQAGSFGPDGLRVWSAGCSNGSEPYSIAFSVLEHLDRAELEKARILGTDIDPKMIAHGREGVYPRADLEPIGRELMRKHTTPVSGDPDYRQIGGVARKMVTLRELNIHDPWPFRKKFDVIFCRNVTIYFEEAAREKLWMRFADALKPGGVLFVGHSERVRGPAQQEFDNCASTTYRRV